MTPASALRSYRSVDPSTGEVLRTYPTATPEEAEHALASAHAGFAAWRARSLEDRVALVRRIGQAFAEKARELGAIAHEEMGKPLEEAVGEAEFSASIFEYYAANAARLLGDQELPTEAKGRAVVQRVATGPILGIMPWNFPFYQVARFAAPNLVLGNTVVLKHAESVPGCAEAIASLIADAGAPDGVYVNAFLDHEQIAAAIADPRVQGVSLTGSERAGAAVGALAGAALKKCVLELGGSDPFIVLDTADVEALAETAWDFRMYNTGQACNSNKRLIVHRDLHDAFVAALVRRAGAVAADAANPLSSRAAAEALDEQVRDAVEHGAVLHVGGDLAPAPSARYTPAVLTGVQPGMRAYDEELFGPVFVVYQVDDDEQAVALANASAYGLGGSVFSTDSARAQRVAERLDVGMANVNTPAGEGPELPFGGTKRSGFGRELGPLGLDEFANKRLLFVAG